MPVSGGVTGPTQRRRGSVILAAISLILMLCVGRLVQINTSLHTRLLSIAQEQQRGISVLPARRGTIFDTRGRVVSASRQLPDVFVDPSRVGDPAKLAEELAIRLNLSPADVAEKIKRRPAGRFIVIASRIDEATAEAVAAMHHPAVGLSQREVRSYPLIASMAHVVGFVGREGGGLEGVELSYDGHLRGRDGRRGAIRDGRRRSLWPADDSIIEPVDGGHIVLTLDAEIQRTVEEALQESVEEFEAEGGVALVMSPNDGHILAMACLPSYDANEAASQPVELRRNRAVTDPAEPGSTFKPFVACGALEGGFVSTFDKIDCHMGEYHLGGRVLTDTSPHGLMDIAQIITYSSNIGMALVGERMGAKALHRTIRSFGFGERTGADCPGEAPGIVYPLRDWTSYSTASVSMGYELSVTPLQLITGFCALLNDGVLVRPRLVRQLLGPTGDVVKSFDSPVQVRRAVSSSVARYMTCELLTSAVKEGTGKRARTEHYRVLGKTGTPKLAYRNRGGYEPGAYLPTFIGAAPANDPKIAVLVMVRRPNARKDYYGGKVAAPAASRIIAEVLPYLGVPRDDDEAFVSEGPTE